MTEILISFIGAIIRPIIREELQSLKDFAFNQYQRLQAFERYERESLELIELAAKATTSEERWAHVRRLHETRARLLSN